jgi:flagellar hook assembly protein FlgD
VLEPSGSTTPDGFELDQNYPNPFNPETRIRFTLPVDGDMTLRIYNSAGQMVRSLADGTHRAGIYDVTWDGRDDAGHNAASGTYLYNLQMPTAGLAETRRMTLTR